MTAASAAGHDRAADRDRHQQRRRPLRVHRHGAAARHVRLHDADRRPKCRRCTRSATGRSTRCPPPACRSTHERSRNRSTRRLHQQDRRRRAEWLARGLAHPRGAHGRRSVGRREHRRVRGHDGAGRSLHHRRCPQICTAAITRRASRCSRTSGGAVIPSHAVRQGRRRRRGRRARRPGHGTANGRRSSTSQEVPGAFPVDVVNKFKGSATASRGSCSEDSDRRRQRT